MYDFTHVPAHVLIHAPVIEPAALVACAAKSAFTWFSAACISACSKPSNRQGGGASGTFECPSAHVPATSRLERKRPPPNCEQENWGHRTRFSCSGLELAFFSRYDRPVRPSKRLESEITTVIAGATALGSVIPGFSVVTTPPGKGTSSSDTLIRPHSKHHACKAAAEHTRRAQARWQPQHG